MSRVCAFIIALILFFAVTHLPIQTSEADDSHPDANYVVYAAEPIHTTSRFSFQSINQVKILPKKTVYKDDPTREIGDNIVLNQGKNGKMITIWKVTYYEGKEFDRQKTSVTITPAEDMVIAKGTKIVWRTLDTPQGQIRYWQKIRVWATDYDSHCPGCNEWTATGMHQGKGVIAVDPSVIKLGTKVFVPGYGPAVAGDTGGAVKGNIIDLGYVDAKTSGWYAHYVDIYLE